MSKIQQYLQESYMELKKVAWPTRAQAVRDSLLVIGISVGVALFLGVADYVYNYGLQILLDSFR